MMHVISVPYSLMKVNPLSWIQKVCQYKGQTHTPPATQLTPLPPFTCLSNRLNANFLCVCLLVVCVCVSPPPAKVACVKSRDMHWALVAHKDQKDINLSSLRMLLVADGSNPCKVTLGLAAELFH